MPGVLAMEIDTDRIDDAILALIYLTLHDDLQSRKGFDVDALGRLHDRGVIENPAGSLESVNFTPDGLARAKTLFESMFARRSAEQPVRPARIEGSAKYPAISVELADLGNQMWPILRRVSYAMSDADVDDAEIERYKS